ncbi:MAG: sigma-70 family RNA polymerase sigma factor [Planctomycetota bacterium]
MPDDAEALPLADVWRRHEAELRAFAARRLGDQDAAEEAVADVFAAACDPALVTPTHWRGWLFTALRRRIVDRLRHANVADRAEEEVAKLVREPTGVFKDGFFVARPKAWTGQPEASAKAAEFWADFDAAVDRLPMKMRQAFTLRELDEVPTDEVCRLLSVTSGNLWTLIHRARLRLKEDLAHHFEA